MKEEWRSGGFDAVYNFPLYYATVDAICDGSHMGRLAVALSESARVDGELGRLVNFLDNHDLPRVRGRCRPEVVDLALTTLFASPGIPMVTWGTESGLEGAEEPENRGDMVFASAEQRVLLTDLNRLRGDTLALRHGDLSVLSLSESSLLVVRRAGESVALLAVNQSEDLLVFDLPPELSSVRWNGVDSSNSPRPFVVDSGSAILVTGTDPLYQPLSLETRVVRLQVSDGLLANSEGAVLGHVSGSGELLGGWEPSGALPITGGAVELSAPVGAVLEFKLLAKDGDSLTWEAGANRYVLVESGSGDLVVDLE